MKRLEDVVVVPVGSGEVGKVIPPWVKFKFLICARVLYGSVSRVGHAGLQRRNDWMGIVATTSHITPLFQLRLQNLQ